MFHRMERNRFVTIMASGVICLSSLWASTADAETILRLAHASAPESLINQAVQKFADEVSDISKGSIKVQIFPNAQLGDEGPIADGVGAGAIDIGLGGAVDAIDPRLRAVLETISTLVLLAMGVAFLISAWAVWQRSWMVPTSVLRLPTGVITATVLILGLSAVCIAISRLPEVIRPLVSKHEKERAL